MYRHLAPVSPSHSGYGMRADRCRATTCLSSSCLLPRFVDAMDRKMLKRGILIQKNININISMFVSFTLCCYHSSLSTYTCHFNNDTRIWMSCVISFVIVGPYRPTITMSSTTSVTSTIYSIPLHYHHHHYHHYHHSYCNCYYYYDHAHEFTTMGIWNDNCFYYTIILKCCSFCF